VTCGDPRERSSSVGDAGRPQPSGALEADHRRAGGVAVVAVDVEPGRRIEAGVESALEILDGRSVVSRRE